MSDFNYVIGNALEPIGNSKTKIIIHICNDIGAWGAGFVKAISAKWRKPEKQYKEMKRRYLGDFELVQVEDDIYVANIIGQEGIKPSAFGVSPIRYGAVEKALSRIFLDANRMESSVHMPRIGCGLAGGKWSIMSATIKSAAEEVGFDGQIYVYDFVDSSNKNYVKPNLN